MISIKEEAGIFYVTRVGEITLQDIKSYIDQFDKSFKHYKRLFLIEDANQAIPKYKAEGLEEIHEEIKTRIGKYDIVKVAVIVNNPINTALSMLYANLSETIKNYHYKTFSTLEAAERWIKE